ncbi:MAG TPA: sigma-70 family RNA polymerase sigma factor [Kofleriaceae bacterium]|jgi:RNA polymerase sigma-70 factor (ECF subfamily)
MNDLDVSVRAALQADETFADHAGPTVAVADRGYGTASRSYVAADRPEVTFNADDRDFVYAVARRIVGAPSDAEDVAQEALLLAFRNRDAFRGESKYRTWLYRIAATTALGHLRRKARSREQLATDHEALARELPADSPPADRVLADQQAICLVRAALAQLDPKYRDVMLLRANRTEVETAERLGISVGNVKVRAHRARKQLQDALASQFE